MDTRIVTVTDIFDVIHPVYFEALKVPLNRIGEKISA